MEQKLYRACERIQNKNKTKSRYIEIDHAFYCTLSMVSLRMASMSDVKKEYFLVMAEIQLSLIKK